MIDLSALTQAQNWNKKYPLIGSQGDAKDSEMMDVVVAAVDAVLEADQTEAAMSTGFDSTRWMIITTVPGSGRYAVVPVETP